jgi:peptidoglycan hydrolase-like protein with peptidoglycan-binding domain
VLTAEVVEQRLDADVSVRLRASPDAETKITTAPTVDGALPVVTAASPPVGSVVVEGQPLLVVTGRPLLLLGGRLDAYRDLTPGAVGPDVQQVEDSLARLGLLGERPDEAYGESTKSAIRALYERAGFAALEYAPQGPSEADLREAIARAQAARANARRGIDPEAVVAADGDLRQATDELAGHLTAKGPLLPRREVVFAEGWPLFVGESRTALGRALPEGAFLTLRTKAVSFRGSLTPSLAANLEPGQAVVVSDGGGSVTLDAVLDGVAVAPGKDGSVAIRVRPTGDVPGALLDREVKGTIKPAATEPVLAVPVSALVTRSDGSVHVLKRGANGMVTDIPVRVGEERGGLSAVAPVKGTLVAGDRVITGG